MSVLAINGGKPIRTTLFPAHNFISDEEKNAVMSVLDSGNLSQFIGAWHSDFYGGSKVLELESLWTDLTSTKHAVAMNSNTSGLFAAIGAAGVGPGDEVIVSPYTMAASATAIIGYNGVPIFADIEYGSYCLDPEDIRKKITPRTKAIMVVHIFGHPADMDSIMAIAREHNLIVIEDAAQSPGAEYKGIPIGGLGDMTIFSLNYHKHIHAGEGGVITTNSDDFATRLQLIRNHGEAVVGEMGIKNIANTFGFNLRPSEMMAAVAVEQTKKLPTLLDARIANAEFLNRHLKDIPGISPPETQKGAKHVYYVQAFLTDESLLEVSRDKFVDAVAAELPLPEDREWPLIFSGYVEPLYMLPMYRERLAYGASGCPFTCPHYAGNVEYGPGLCPITEVINTRLIGTEFMRPPSNQQDMQDVVNAFEKVYQHRDELR